MSKKEYLWQDGTWHNMPEQEYLNSTMSKSRVAYERLVFLFRRIHFLFSNFKSIEVSKRRNSMGDFEYRCELKRPLNFKNKSVSEKTQSSFVGCPLWGHNGIEIKR